MRMKDDDEELGAVRWREGGEGVVLCYILSLQLCTLPPPPFASSSLYQLNEGPVYRTCVCFFLFFFYMSKSNRS